MKILVTGAAGFIGYHVCKKLVEDKHNVIGLDNLNNYYDVGLKISRLEQLGIEEEKIKDDGKLIASTSLQNFQFLKMDLQDRERLPELFASEGFDAVCNLAAQAGVRYSLENPETYIDSNIVGFLNILEGCRYNNVKHLVYASSSSVYGLNKKVPFETSDSVDHPISLYAASKKSNELMAHTYSHLYGFKTTGLRLFTVYGPWGRPDMAMFLFTKAILSNKPINVFNKGNMERDFTYIDDITEGVVKIVEDNYTEQYDSKQLYNLYNIGNNKSIKLMDFIEAIEHKLGVKAEKNLMDMQPGDVEKTWANVDSLIRDYNYSPNTPIKEGINAFIDWYRGFYNT